MNIYTYGSLRLQVIWDLVTGRKFKTTSAFLSDHIALKVKGETFPGLIERAGETTKGVVYHDVDEETVAVLDEFESGIYVRVPVTVRTTSGSILTCETYLVKPDSTEALLNVEWDFEDFRSKFLDDFIKHNIGQSP